VVITLAAYDRKREISEAALNIKVPGLLFGGSKDPVTPPAKNQLPIYESLQSGYKAFINIIGGSHCQMSDQHKSCKMSELLLFSTPDISREKQHEILESFILPWLSFHLKENEEALNEFNSLLLEVDPISFVREFPEK
jgi:pimeloyl-ACP methyl ester carboxylesterase